MNGNGNPGRKKILSFVLTAKVLIGINQGVLQVIKMTKNKKQANFEQGNENQTTYNNSKRQSILHTSSLNISLQDIPKDITLGELINSKQNFSATISFSGISEKGDYAQNLVDEVANGELHK